MIDRAAALASKNRVCRRWPALAAVFAALPTFASACGGGGASRSQPVSTTSATGGTEAGLSLDIARVKQAVEQDERAHPSTEDVTVSPGRFKSATCAPLTDARYRGARVILCRVTYETVSTFACGAVVNGKTVTRRRGLQCVSSTFG